MLPDLTGQTILDMGCGVGDQARDFIERGAKVIGVDLNEEMLDAARLNCPGNARFINDDFRNPLDLDEQVHGLWCSFAVAYNTDFKPVLDSWKQYIKKGGWIALTEIDNFFGHKPLSENAENLLEEYTKDAFRDGRYDFYMGHKLVHYLKESGFSIKESLILNDLEFSFSGPAEKEVIEAWRKRFERMTLLQNMCGSRYEEVREEFLSSLQADEHRSHCKVISCIGIRRA